MRILVSARLHATAAPEAPEPMISTSTLSLPAMSALPVVSPEGGTPLDGFQQRPVALLHRVALGERRTRLVPHRYQHAIVAVIGTEDRPSQRGRRPAAGAIPFVDQRLALVVVEACEIARGLGL